MGKFFGYLFIIVILSTAGAYYYYTQTGYKFGLEESFLFKSTIGIISRDFSDGKFIPVKYACDGDNLIPEFKLERIPSGTKSLAAILEDVSVKPQPRVHWVIFNIDPDITKIDKSIWQRGVVGINDFGNKEYAGPCPVTGETHRYRFNVYALNTTFVAETLSGLSLEKLMTDHILASGWVAGVYTLKP